jgi:hypothetical protein
MSLAAVTHIKGFDWDGIAVQWASLFEIAVKNRIEHRL